MLGLGFGAWDLTCAIIAGTLKGRRLDAPDWDGLRPTSDKLRETLFNVLAPRIGGARVLDGYAGTGAVGIEALSRGAAHVTFVEPDRRAVGADRAQPASTAASRTAMLLSAQVCGRGAHGCPQGRSTSMLLDPPYGQTAWRRRSTRRRRSSRPAGCWCSSTRRRDVAPAAAASIAKTRDILSGDSALTLYFGQPRPASGRDRRGGATPAHSRERPERSDEPCPARSWLSTRARSTR